MKPALLAPSLLSADFARLGEDAQNVLNCGADLLHFDVMDNHYVPTLTVGPLVCQSLRDFGIQAPIDVHLMVQPVDSLIRQFAEAGASQISFHPEASLHVDRSLSLIQAYNCKAGLAINPATSLSCLDFVMDKLDFILIMTVNPGFGGQAFIPSMLKKIERTRHWIDQHQVDVDLFVDGGVKIDNIAEIRRAGANGFVAGSAIFKSKDYQATIQQFRQEIQKGST